MLKLIAILFLSSFSLNAFAYLDPGTGSLILQGLIAGIAMAGITIKTYWYKLCSMFGKSQPKSLLDEDDDKLSTDKDLK